MNIGMLSEEMPANVSVLAQAMVTAAFANEVRTYTSTRF
jgi:hypothetical protein